MRLEEIEAYYDAVPRPTATTVEIGPFTLFLAEEGTGWQFYARPRLGLIADITPDDVRRVLDHQRELGATRCVEWVDEVTPSLLQAVREAVTGDHTLELCPLLLLPDGSPVPDADRRTRVLDPDDPDLSTVLGAISAGFAGRNDARAVDAGARSQLMRDGLLVVVGTYDDGAVVGGGSAAPRGRIAELMGISIMPSARRQGLGSATTAALVAACRCAGVGTTFLSAGSDDAASSYIALGFRRRATAVMLTERG